MEDTENEDADLSSNNLSVLTDNDNSYLNDDAFYGESHNKVDLQLVDRSFTNLGYIGYGDGIKLEDLDQDPNW